MTRADLPTRALAVSLSGLAGFVDATGFLATKGFFVSFMSGNSTQVGVGLGGAHPLAVPAGLVLSFVLGAALGEAAGRAGGGRRGPVVLLLVAACLAVGALAAATGQVGVALAAAALAMGSENAVFESGGEVRIGVTYMTGTLVKLGQRLAGALLGGPPWAWLPHLALWLGLVGGAAAGSAAFPAFGLQGLWFAAAIAALLAGWSAWLATR